MSCLSSFLHESLRALFAKERPWEARLQTFESQVGHLPGLFSPTLARQLATDPQSTLPTDPQIWFEVWPLLPTQLRPFFLHCFAFSLPRMAAHSRSALPPLADLLYPEPQSDVPQTAGFDQLTLIWGLYQWEQLSGTAPNTVIDLNTLNGYYARANRLYPAYRLNHESLRAGWVHVLVSALNLYEKHPHKLLHPLLVNSLKALWNESRQQSQTVVQILQAVETPALQSRWRSFRTLFERHEAGLKAQHKTRQIQDELYAQWSQQAPITPPLQKALQRLLHEGPLGHVQTFIRQHAAYLPQGLQPLPYGYRRENQEWTWRSHADFSDHSPRDQAERLAQQHFDQALIAYYQTEHAADAHLPTLGIQGKRQVQSRWWSAGEALFIQALRVHQAMLQHQHPPQDLYHHNDLYWCKDPALRTVFLDACERLACPDRAGLQVSKALQDCAISFITHLNHPVAETPEVMYDDTPLKFDTPDGGERLIQAMTRWSLEQVNAALQEISPAEQALYQAWARRQSGGVPIDGFCQPLLYEPEHPGRLTGEGNAQTMTPAVLLWGTLHRPPLTSIPLPFVSRLHMHEVTPVSDLLRYWASYALLGWRQQFQFLQTQHKKREAEYERIQRAFHAIQKHREAENRAWADLRNQLDPPELLAYGVASTYALNRSYSRLHRPEQIESAQHLPCFLAELATGKSYTHQAEALDTLTHIHQSQPQTLIAELYDYWQNLPPEQRTTLQAQKLFNYCKMVVYDGSQIEGQLPGKLSLMQVVHTLHRVQQNHQSQQRTHLQGPVFQWQGEKNLARNLNTLPLKRLLRSDTLQQELMGQALHQIHDTHRIWPCFRLGIEETALRWMAALYALCTVHFAPPRPGQTPPEQALYLRSVQLKTSGQGLQLQICLNDHFSRAARQTLETLSTAEHAAAHDLRNTLYTLREASGVAQNEPWFKTSAVVSPAVYFEVAETTQLMVNLPL